MIKVTLDSIELFGDIIIPTSCGRNIHFMESRVKATLELDIVHKDAGDDLPTDVLSATLFISDSDGNIWSVQSRTTTAYLVEKMVDLSSYEPSLIPISSAPDELKKVFLNECLLDLRYSSDDRFYRQIILGAEILQFPFQYTTIHFDIAFFQEFEGLDSKIAVHVREDSLLFEGDSLEPFYYFIDWKGLFRSNTATYSKEYECWQDNPLPSPLVFIKTNKTSEANEDVKVN